MEEGVHILLPEEIPLVLISLNYLVDETQLNARNLEVLRHDACTSQSDIRAAGSKFIVVLLKMAPYLNLDLKAIESHPSIQTWKKIGENDPLPEVRRPWESPDSPDLEEY